MALCQDRTSPDFGGSHFAPNTYPPAPKFESRMKRVPVLVIVKVSFGFPPLGDEIFWTIRTDAGALYY